MTTTTTIRLSDEEKDLLSSYAKVHGTTISEFMRRTALERIEDDLDLAAWEKAHAEFEEDPTTISAIEIAKKYL
ncbi:type II toxin-antitoxin system RelB family antitoxin [Actinomyces culturomici]|uniref:type II toxin-antitoxin system RelB family antitoxin n=1 Tax=Actinomyces culturomici TaxID=1926276 RepID=UPI000E1FC222|nr:DUF6290 family protein [Actinomyces culturomici]